MNTIVIYAVLIALTAGGLLITTGSFAGVGVAEAALSSRSYGDPNQIGDPNERTYTESNSLLLPYFLFF
jgi:hypothetical protein